MKEDFADKSLKMSSSGSAGKITSARMRSTITDFSGTVHLGRIVRKKIRLLKDDDNSKNFTQNWHQMMPCSGYRYGMLDCRSVLFVRVRNGPRKRVGRHHIERFNFAVIFRDH